MALGLGLDEARERWKFLATRAHGQDLLLTRAPAQKLSATLHTNLFLLQLQRRFDNYIGCQEEVGGCAKIELLMSRREKSSKNRHKGADIWFLHSDIDECETTHSRIVKQLSRWLSLDLLLTTINHHCRRGGGGSNYRFSPRRGRFDNNSDFHQYHGFRADQSKHFYLSINWRLFQLFFYFHSTLPGWNQPHDSTECETKLNTSTKHKSFATVSASNHESHERALKSFCHLESLHSSPGNSMLITRTWATWKIRVWFA